MPLRDDSPESRIFARSRSLVRDTDLNAWRHASCLVQPLAHHLAGLEERYGLQRDRDMRPGARIASGAGRPVLDREGYEAAQFHPITSRHRSDNLVQDCVDDVL